MNDLYQITVSLLPIRKEPSEPSRVQLSKDTIVKDLKHDRQHKKEPWALVETVSEPVIRGYVQKKYLRRC